MSEQPERKNIPIMGPFDDFNIQQLIAHEEEKGYRLYNKALDRSAFNGKGMMTLQFELVKRK